jgi:hypothetical protein
MAKSQRKTKKSNPGAEKDRPEQAMESGEPRETGRSRGRVIDDRGIAEGTQAKGRTPEANNDTESGRHGAVGGDDERSSRRRR